MNTTVIHGGHFVYERPLLLLAVYLLQVALVIVMAYGGNDLYFKVNKPQRCLRKVVPAYVRRNRKDKTPSKCA